MATLLCVTCCARLTTLLRRFATCEYCWRKFEIGELWTTNTQNVATRRNKVPKRSPIHLSHTVVFLSVARLSTFQSLTKVSVWIKMTAMCLAIPNTQPLPVCWLVRRNLWLKNVDAGTLECQVSWSWSVLKLRVPLEGRCPIKQFKKLKKK